MNVHKILILDQKEQNIKELAQQHQTTEGVCGFVTCAIISYISQNGFDRQNIKQINQENITPLMV
jgi:hypothetical protein